MQSKYKRKNSQLYEIQILIIELDIYYFLFSLFQRIQWIFLWHNKFLWHGICFQLQRLTSLNCALNSVATNYSTSVAHYGKDGSQVVCLTKMSALITAFYLYTEGLGSAGLDSKPLELSRNTFLFRWQIINFTILVLF